MSVSERIICCLDCDVERHYEYWSAHIEVNEEYYRGLEEFMSAHDGHRISVKEREFSESEQVSTRIDLDTNTKEPLKVTH